MLICFREINFPCQASGNQVDEKYLWIIFMVAGQFLMNGGFMRAGFYIFSCVFFCFVLAVMFFRFKPRRSVRTSRGRLIKQRPYEKENEVAHLLMKASELKRSNPTWPVILCALNPDDSPQIRTRLLEIRQMMRDEPSRAISMIELCCIYSPKPNESFDAGIVLDVAVDAVRYKSHDSSLDDLIKKLWAERIS